MNASLAEATKYDSATKVAGILQGDSVMVGLQNALRGMITSLSSGSSFRNLADVGISMQLGGALSVNGAANSIAAATTSSSTMRSTKPSRNAASASCRAPAYSQRRALANPM